MNAGELRALLSHLPDSAPVVLRFEEEGIERENAAPVGYFENDVTGLSLVIGDRYPVARWTEGTNAVE